MFGYRVLGFGSGAAGSVTHEVDYLVIAGGGGGSPSQGAGAGAGGFRTSFPGGTKIELISGTQYNVTVGDGGTGGSNGGDSNMVLETTIESTGGCGGS